MNKIKAIIFDIDGTIADRGTRHHFDFTKVIEYLPKKDMSFLFHYMQEPDRAEYGGEEVDYIFVTGRPESCRSDTERWLHTYDFRYDTLYMRPVDNKEQDARLKLQIYREYILDKYEVIAVFEDSERCAEMYRTICGLTVLTVK